MSDFSVLLEVLRRQWPSEKRQAGQEETQRATPAVLAAIHDLNAIVMERILLNLAANARDAMRQGGTLTIETANVAPEASASTARWAVTPEEGIRYEQVFPL